MREGRWEVDEDTHQLRTNKKSLVEFATVEDSPGETRTHSNIVSSMV